MKPNKIHWYLGSSSLALMMEQDRKHWLKKTDKKKYIQDPSGDEFQGRIDNLGSDVIVETEKLPYVDEVVKKARFTEEELANVLDFQASTFPNIPELPGLKFTRLKSINFLYQGGYHNFRLVLKNCHIIYVTIASGDESGDVLVYKWYQSPAAVLQLMDENEQYTIEIPISFSAGVTDVNFYYPCDEEIQPFALNGSSSNTVCITEGIVSDEAIGYPLFWFNCAESKIGPIIKLGNNYTPSMNPLSKLLTSGHAGNESDYAAYLYPATGLSSAVTPDGAAGSWVIKCDPASPPFTGTSVDFTVPITNIRFEYNGSVNEITTNASVGENVYYMASHADWTYDNVNDCYSIPVESFIANVYDDHNVLVPAFRVELDDSLSFEDKTTDVGYAGMRFISSKTPNEQQSKYPYDINNMEGLPDHIRNNDPSTSGQQLSVYAIHNTPYYNPDDPDTRQIAGLLFDPGVEKTSSSDTPFETDEIGRVYVLSNDDISYVNNATTQTPKPARTLARICDIPTSVMQLTNISGLAPTVVVDKKYVRSLVSYTEEDKDRLYNGLRPLWVKPTHLDDEGLPIYPSLTQSNKFIFDSFANLNSVDLINHNDFRTLTNLNPMVDPADVSVANIPVTGSGYAVGDYGVVVVGGFSFTYHVESVNESGGVTDATIAPNENVPINLANFDLYSEFSGLTKPYGTSPLGESEGTDMRLQFMIANYDSLLPQKGDVVKGLYAFAKDSDGIWLCTYKNDFGQTPAWVKEELIANANVSYTASEKGYVSPVDAYMDSIIPSVRAVTVSKLAEQEAEVTIYSYNTAASMNIVDQNATPVRIPPTSGEVDNRTVIDINKFYSRGFAKLTAQQKNVTGVIAAIKSVGLDAFDSYIIWKWVSEAGSNRQFEFAVIRRSLNNYRSTDSSSSLPNNDLVCKRFVHTNPGSTVVWNVDRVGPMVWMFNPESTTHEKYYVDSNTRDLCVTRTEITWADVEVTDISRRERIDIVDADGLLKYNILTNSSAWISGHATTPIYQQPDYQQLSNCTIGSTPGIVPKGTWELVFPQIHTFTFRNENTSVSHTPVRMHVIRGNNMNPDVVSDENGNAINYKTLLMSTNSDTNRVELKSYNPNTGDWDIL